MVNNTSKLLLKGPIVELVNLQIAKEHQASLTYLGMATWATVNGYPGATKFLYAQSDEERQHMFKFIHYLTKLDISPVIPYQMKGEGLPKYNSLQHLFQKALAHEVTVTKSIHQIVKKTLVEEDFATFEFLQFFVQEQREEESTIRTILELFDKIEEEGPIGRYTIDKEIENMCTTLTIN